MNTIARFLRLTLIACLGAAVPVFGQGPVIFQQPVGQTLLTGTTAHLSVTVSDPDVSLPPTSGTLRLWLKADAGVVTNSSGQVSQWQDQSGNANHATQGTVSKQPSISYPAALNGKPVLTFNPASPNTSGKYLQGNADVGIPNAYTSFLVYKARELTNADNVLAFVGIPSTYGGARNYGIVNSNLIFGTWTYDYYSGFSPSANTYRIWTDRFNTNLNFAEMFDTTSSGTTNFSFSTSGQSAPQPGYYVGGLDPAVQFVVSGRNFDGEIAELLYYRGSLSETDRQAVQRYLTFKYLVQGTHGPFTYQWQFNGSVINNATNSTLNLTNVVSGSSGSYTVVVSNSVAATTSSPAVLTVGDPPSISSQPANQTAVQGSTASFSVGATGTAPLSYAWQLNGSPISGATTSTLSVANVQTSNAGSYSVVVSSPFGSATSASATLNISLKPVITVQPQSQVVVIGSNALFSVTASQQSTVLPPVSSGTLRLWLKADAGVTTNGAGQVALWGDQSGNSNDASQATPSLQPTLTFPAGLSGKPAVHFNGVQNNTTGQYINGTGDVSIPDAFTAFCVYETVNNANNENVPFFIGVPGNIGYARGLNIAMQTNYFVAWGNDYSTGIPVVPNAFRICADRLNTNETLVDVFETTASGSTNVTEATSGLGAPGAGYYVGGLNPNLTYVGTSRTLAGDVAELIVFKGALTEADRLATENYLKQKYYQVGIPSGLTYQWQFNGVNIDGATNSSLTVGSVQTTNAGTYSVIVCDGAACATSTNAILFPTQSSGAALITAQPQSLTAVTGSSALFSVGVAQSGASYIYQWQFNNVILDGATSSVLSLTNVQASNVGAYGVIVSDGTNAVISSNAVLSIVAPQNPNCTPAPSGIIGWWPAEGDATDVIGADNGALVNSVAFTSGKVGQAFSFNGGNYVNIPDSATLHPSSVTVAGWFSFASASGVQVLVAKTAGTGTYESFIIYDQDGTLGVTAGGVGGIGQILNYQLSPTANTWYHLAYTFDNATKQQAIYVNGVLKASGANNVTIDYDSHPVMIGAEYENEYLDYFFGGKADEVMLFNRALSAGELQQIYSAGTNGVCSGLLITSQPQSASVGVGATTTFSVGAVGTSSVSYQWMYNGAAIAGATGSALTLTNIQLTDAGTYSVAVNDVVAALVSSNAVLNVGFAPAISAQPMGQTVVQGTASVSFSVTATGSTPLAYQWYFNGVAIAQGAGSSLSLANLREFNSGVYSMVVTNLFGAATSSNAVLQVDAPPQITSQPASQYAAVGSTVTMNAGVSGASALPTVVSGALRLWLRGDAGVVTNGAGQISQWLDQSGNGNNATQANSSQQPLLVNPVGINGLGAVRFDGVQSSSTGDFMQGSGDVGIPNAFTAFILYSESSAADPNGNGKDIALIGVPSVAGSCRGFAAVNNDLTFTSWSNDYLSTLLLPVNSYRVATLRFNTNQNLAELFDRTSSSSNSFAFSTSGQTSPGAGYYLGGMGSQLRNFAGDIAELIVYRGALSDSDRLSVEEYLQQKYYGVAGVSFNYQWQFDGADLPGATNGSLVITNVQLANAGTYDLIVSNTAGTATSSNATLIVGYAPSIGVQPQSQSVPVNSTLSLSVTAGGTDPLSYQWRLNGTPIASATSSTLTVTNIQTAVAGSYSVVITNLFGTLTSSNALVRVDTYPQIFAQPQSQTVTLGNGVAFSVGTDPVLPTVASGTLRLWLKGDAGVTTNSNGQVSQWRDQSLNANDAGQLNSAQQPILVRPAAIGSRPALRFDGVQSSSSGDYLRGTNDVGIPDAYTSFVVAEPSSLASVNVPLFVGTPGTVGSARGYALIAGQLNLTTWNNDYNTGFSPSPGTYRIWTERFNTNRTFAEMFDRTASTGTNFSWTVSNIQTPASGYYIGSLASFTRSFAGDIAEVIYYRGSLSESDRLAVEAYLKQKYYQSTAASGSLSYQWQFNGANISGATNSMLNIASAQGTNAGTYNVVVCNGSACVTSSNATLTINFPPTITLQPVSQTVIVSTPVSFTSDGTGTALLSYQWTHNGQNVSGATTSSLSISDVQPADAGSYALVLSSPYGSATSSSAVLGVTASTVVAGNVSGTGSGTITVPISLIALGNENALSFSLTFDPNYLRVASAVVGSNASAASLFVNANPPGSGQAGFLISLATDEVFPAGTQEVALVTFNVGLVTNAVVIPIGFGDSPAQREITDPVPNVLPGTYVAGSASLAATAFEGDVSPRPSGDQHVSLSDFVQVGRFVAGLDIPTDGTEFQRADCAPRGTLGNGLLTVSDWVQAGRYAVGLDPLTPIGGPTTASGGGGSGGQQLFRSPRAPSITRAVTLQQGANNGTTNVISVELNAQGDENAVGFTLLFDPSVVRFAGAAIGSGAAGGGSAINVNSVHATNGVVGVAVQKGIGQTFAAGTQECVRLSFVPITYSSTTSNLTFANSPVYCEVADVTANPLASSYVNNSLSVGGLVPSLTITQDGSGNVTLTWPAAATGYGLESVSDLNTPWSPVNASVTTAGANSVMTQPASTNQLYFRLRQP